MTGPRGSAESRGSCGSCNCVCPCACGCPSCGCVPTTTAATDDDERPVTAGEWAAALHLAIITTPVDKPYAWVNREVAMDLVQFLREIEADRG